MPVYFDSSLWKQKGDEPCQCRLDIRAIFTENGLKRCIPTVYCFSKGIVFDILTVIDAEKLETYYKNYIDRVKEAMSDAQRRKVMQDNPYQNLEIERMWVNGRMAENVSYSSTGCVPFQEMKDKEEKQVLKEIQEAYSEFLAGAENFFCQRVCVKMEEDFTNGTLDDIRLKTREKRQVFLFNQELTLKDGEEGSIQIVHPVTKAVHQIYFYDVQLSEELSLRETAVQYFTAVAEIVPKLSEDESLLFSSNVPYNTSHKKAGSVSIIGGSSGPTSIFMAGVVKEDESHYGGTVVPCFSKPFFVEMESNTKKEEEIIGRFCIEGMERIDSMGKMIALYSK